MCEQASPENPAPRSRAGPQETRWGPLAPCPCPEDSFLQGQARRQALGRGASWTDGLPPCMAHTDFGDHFAG